MRLAASGAFPGHLPLALPFQLTFGLNDLGYPLDSIHFQWTIELFGEG